MEATKADSWNCDLCEVSNKNREDFTKHMAERHLSWSKQNIFGEEENAWWVKCIICGQQTETRKEFWNHTAANHLQLGLPGDVIGSVLESVSGRDYVVDGGQESDETVDEIDDENHSSFGGDVDIEIDDYFVVESGMLEIRNEEVDSMDVDVDEDCDIDVSTDEVFVV